MASRVTCDGCHRIQTEGDPFTTVGYVRSADYCPECLADYREFEKSRNDLHTELAQVWESHLKGLEEQWHAKHPEGRLPDR